MYFITLKSEPNLNLLNSYKSKYYKKKPIFLHIKRIKKSNQVNLL